MIFLLSINCTVADDSTIPVGSGQDDQANNQVILGKSQENDGFVYILG